jgi:hypothetical protein
MAWQIKADSFTFLISFSWSGRTNFSWLEHLEEFPKRTIDLDF